VNRNLATGSVFNRRPFSASAQRLSTCSQPGPGIVGLDTDDTEDRMKITNAAVVLLAAGALAACGGGGDSASPEVASLDEDTATTDTATDGSGESEPTPEDREEALLEFAQCMRDHGIDMPDPQISEDGSGGVLIEQGEGGSGMDPESEEFQAAQEECEPILEEGMGEIELDPEQQAEMQEQLLEFAECMRDHGIDMPDPVFGEDGRVEIQANGPAGDADPGQDPREDDDFQAAQEACAPDGFGPGAAPADTDGEG
jgi:hypothetical protein